MDKNCVFCKIIAGEIPSPRLYEARAETLKECFLKIAELKDKLGFENGYRVVINQGENAGQTVHHLHIHLLGGEMLKDL